MQIDGMSVDSQIALHSGELATALDAALDMLCHRGGLVRGEQLHGKQSKVVLFDMSRAAHALNAFLSVDSALRIRVLTVPSGSPVISAISECVRPSKNAISSVFRCSVGRW